MLRSHNVQKSRLAFTLVELLVVIAIIGILVALLLPAVQAAREAARRMQCVNNMKQLALACLNVESTEGAFPTAGGSVEEFANTTTDQGQRFGYEYASWMFQLLPFIEEQILYDLRDDTTLAGNNAFTDTGIIETPVSAFNCPTRFSRFGINGADLYRFGDYAGVMASHFDTGWGGFSWEAWAPPMGYDNRANRGDPEDEVVWTGIIARGGHTILSSSKTWKFKRISFGKITDGSSNTILIAEKAVPTDRYTIDSNSPFQWWEIRGYYSAADWPTMRMFGADAAGVGGREVVPVLGDNAERPGNFNREGPYKVEKGFGSAHPGVFIAAFGDGSTRTISLDADLVLLDQLGKREDGSVAKLP